MWKYKTIIHLRRFDSRNRNLRRKKYRQKLIASEGKCRKCGKAEELTIDYETVEDEEFKRCWSLENLQPLEKSANKIKNNNY